MKLKTIAVLCTMAVAAQAEESMTLDEIQVQSSAESYQSDPLSGVAKPNDIVVGKKQLKTRASTLGNALNNELGVHSNQFGGGASAPIIRGQEGVRLKILQNGSDVVDMSQLSPDHSIGVDTLLAEQVEIVRGAATLLYANASPAGVINVIDKRIPTAIPEKGYAVETSIRYNDNNREKLATTGITAGIGKHIALRFEGLTRHAKNYHVPNFNLDVPLNYVPDTQNKAKSGTYGISFIGERGYIGAAYSERKELYGLPGHDHALDTCGAHIWGGNEKHNYYLGLYPHLMDNSDLVNTHFHCGSNHSSDTHSHTNPYGHYHNHNWVGPMVDMHSKRYDVKGELKNPLLGLEKIRASYSETRYFHSENDHDIPVNLFKHNGYNMRLEFFHQPIGGLSGVWGVQYQRLTASANIPRLQSCSNNYSNPCHKKQNPPKIAAGERNHWALVQNETTQTSLFMLEQLRWKDFMFELAGRTEKQKITIDYDVDTLKSAKEKAEGCGSKSAFLSSSFCQKDSYPDPDLSPYNERANSYSLAANWFATTNHQFLLTYSHNERHPTAQELYYHGKHLATVSFEHGNKNLKKEVSDNVELGWTYNGDKLSYQVSVYYNHFKNRIFNQTLSKEGNLSLNRYSQSKAVYYGLEGSLDYAFTPNLSMGIFGDYVRGKLYDLPPTYKVEYLPYRQIESPQLDQNAPRVPPARLGLRSNWAITENLSANGEYIYTYKQHKTAPLENATAGNSLLNLGLTYSKTLGGVDYEIFVQGNNLLNRQIYSHTSFLPFVPQMGRNFTLGINMNF